MRLGSALDLRSPGNFELGFFAFGNGVRTLGFSYE